MEFQEMMITSSLMEATNLHHERGAWNRKKTKLAGICNATVGYGETPLVS